VQEAFVPRWANALVSIAHAASAIFSMTGVGVERLGWVYLIASLAFTSLAVLAAVAAALNRGLYARPRRVRSATWCRNAAIGYAVAALLLLAAVVTEPFQPRSLIVVSVFFSNVVVHFGLWNSVTRGQQNRNSGIDTPT
jgi:multisubunit Na+/H+ antiporter MnhB subunit